FVSRDTSLVFEQCNNKLTPRKIFMTWLNNNWLEDDMNKLSSVMAASVLALSTLSMSALADDRPEFQIGTVNSVTGGGSAIAAGAVSAIDFMEEQLRADKDLPVRVTFVKYDDGSDPTKAVDAVRRLIQQDDVHMVICCTTTPASLAV